MSPTRRTYTSAQDCEHANEVPYACPCRKNCYCRVKGSCRPMDHSPEAQVAVVQVRRPEWDDVWMGLATTLSQRSTCERLRVGCVIVTSDNQRVLGVGYNGGPKGISNECLSLEPGQCGHLHAEMNALIKADYNSTRSKRMYVTNQPCYNCAVAIVNANIKEVIYRHPYRLTDGLDLLLRAKVVIRRMYEKIP